MTQIVFDKFIYFFQRRGGGSYLKERSPHVDVVSIFLYRYQIKVKIRVYLKIKVNINFFATVYEKIIDVLTI